MLVWCGILFMLGILAFMDSLYNYGEIFRQVNSIVFMLVSLGLLIRTTTKMRLKTMELYASRIQALEEELYSARGGADPAQGDTTLARSRADVGV
ncbi:MAG TPA: hypothetical protein VM118_04590 [Acidobacteriota bacterium]|nr:hypothetical protein [Acidobacteriota bacterium]